MHRRLNILYYYAETGSLMTQWQRYHFLDELTRAGHLITFFNPLKYASLAEAYEQLITLIEKSSARFDLFFNSSPDSLLSKDTVMKIRSLGLPSLLICFDNLHAPWIHRSLAPLFDLVWLTSRETTYLFKKWGCNTIFQPYAANPRLFKPEPGEEIPGAVFIGTLYDDRVHRINQLTGAGINCTLFSDSLISCDKSQPGKKLTLSGMALTLLRLAAFDPGRRVAVGRILNKIHSGRNRLNRNDYLQILPSVPFEEVSRIYSNYQFSLNITELRDTFHLNPPVHKLHLRTFEIAMCGGLQMAHRVPELAGYFTDGAEIILCDSHEDFLTRARYWTRPDKASEREKIKRQARLRAEKEHTWSHRFQAVFTALLGGHTWF